jgi:hypothetical protein
MAVCSIIRANRSISCDLEGEGRLLKEGQSAFWMKGDVMVQVQRDRDLYES